MRRPFFVVSAVLSASLAILTPASADQTDPRLDLLFKELRTGEAARAEQNIARIQEIWADNASDTVDLLYERAEHAAAAGERDLAVLLLDHVVGLSPSFAQGYALRGAVRLSQEDQAGALEDFSKTLELEPRHFDVRKAIGNLLLAAGEKRDAYDMFQKVLEWNPYDERVMERARALRRELDGQEI